MELVSLVDVMSMAIERSGSPKPSGPAPLSCATSSRAAPLGASPTQRPATMAHFLSGARRKSVDEDRPFVIEIDREALWQNIGNAERDADMTPLARQDFLLNRRHSGRYVRTRKPTGTRVST